MLRPLKRHHVVHDAAQATPPPFECFSLKLSSRNPRCLRIALRDLLFIPLLDINDGAI
jgi:hypothetical protein